jgi:type I restriction enzyme S subunit
MKDSGIKWLGNIPEHWEVRRAKTFSNIFVPERNKPDLNDYQEGLPWITSEFITEEKLDIDKIKFFVSENAIIDAGIRILKKNSVIASCVGSFNIAVVIPFDCVINQQLQAFIPQNIEPEFLQYSILNANAFFESNATQTTLKYVNKDKFGCLPIAYPPLSEQTQIVNHIKTETATIDTAIAKTLKEIELIKEYKEAMIAEAVMGKVNFNKTVNAQ